MENGVLMQYFEWNLPNDGLLWQRLRDDAAHLADIGITAVWIPPAYKADEQQDEGYATYDLYDFGEFDQKGTVRTKYGTRAQLEEAIEALHSNGVQVILDAVLNHKLGGDYPERFRAVEVYLNNRNRVKGRPVKIEAFTGYSFKGRGGKYSAFKWHWYDFSGTGFDRRRGKESIFKIVGPGKGWSPNVDKENGNYDYLLGNDIDLRRRDVADELVNWGNWAVDTFHFDGFRMDAVKHMDSNFVRKFISSVREAHSPELYAVAEYWCGNIDTLLEWAEATEDKLEMFDVPLHYKFYDAATLGAEYNLSCLFDHTLVAHRPDLAVTLVDNHDTQPDSSLESAIADWFKPMAYAIILLMKDGYPSVFYGDYYDIKGNPSPHRLILDELLAARKKLAYGEQTLYFDDSHVVGLVRHGSEEHPGSGLVLLISNDEDGEKEMTVGPAHAGETWKDITGSISESVTLDAEGKAIFKVKGRNLAVWAKADDTEIQPASDTDQPQPGSDTTDSSPQKSQSETEKAEQV